MEIAINFGKYISKNDLPDLQCKSPVTKAVFDIANLVCGKFDVFEYYGVDKFMDSFALSVDKKYRGRAIGDHLLAAR